MRPTTAFIPPAALFIALSVATPLIAQGTGMTKAEATRLYAAGGFPISPDGKSPLNKCGKPAKPRITLVDVNGDGRKDALFIDSGACYAPDGRWFSIAAKQADGSWRGVAGANGTVKTVSTLTGGWFNLEWTSQGKTVPLRYDGVRYSVPGKASVATTSPPASAKPGASPTTAPASPSSPAGQAAIFRAAGFAKHGTQWKSDCNDPGTLSYGPGTIDNVKDINGDGRPEAIVTESGTYCYGNTGTGFWLVSQQADGTWKLLFSSHGIADFLKTKGTGGWPDISIGGPGFCFPVVRWNGATYAHHRMEYEGKPCKR